MKMYRKMNLLPNGNPIPHSPYLVHLPKLVINLIIITICTVVMPTDLKLLFTHSNWCV